MQKHKHRKDCQGPCCRKKPDKGTLAFVILGLSSLFWLIIRSGKKPSRLQYPCQKIAAGNALAFLAWAASILTGHYLYKKLNLNLKKLAVLAVMFGLCFSAVRVYNLYRIEQTRAQTMGTPQGYKPGRVVWVHDNNATSGTPVNNYFEQYWNYVDQNTVNSMFDTGIKALTGEDTVGKSLSKILPCGTNCTGKKIAIKVNMNNAYYSDKPSSMDANYQPVLSLIKQLTTAEPGNFSPFNQSDIIVYDVSKIMGGNIRGYFTEKIHSAYPDVKLIGDSKSLPPAVFATFNSGTYSVNSVYCTPTGSIDVPDLLKETDYIVDMPLLKGYGSETRATLSFKNHLGSTRSPGYYHPCLAGYKNPNGLVGVYTASFTDKDGSITSIADKTVLIIGDGLYGHPTSNVFPPKTWPRIFGGDSPNSIFFSQDVVAVDSVMYDLIMQEAQHPAGTTEAGQQHLQAAANHTPSLGVHEHWQLKSGCTNANDLNCWAYESVGGIDFVHCDKQGTMDTPCVMAEEPEPEPEPEPIAGCVAITGPEGDVNEGDVLSYQGSVSEGTVNSIKWFFDDVEDTSATGKTSFQISAAGAGTHTVRMSVNGDNKEDCRKTFTVPEPVEDVCPGGTWGFLETTCKDSCLYREFEKIAPCGNAIVSGCDCGPDGCWNGFSCTANPAPGEPPVSYGIEELISLVSKWGTTGPIGDINVDDIVNIDDLILVVRYWD